jgi:hypothetical protein
MKDTPNFLVMIIWPFTEMERQSIYHWMRGQVVILSWFLSWGLELCFFFCFFVLAFIGSFFVVFLYAGSGFVSQDLYLHGYFSASIKLPADYTAGVVVAFYVSSNTD